MAEFDWFKATRALKLSTLLFFNSEYHPTLKSCRGAASLAFVRGIHRWPRRMHYTIGGGMMGLFKCFWWSVKGYFFGKTMMTSWNGNIFRVTGALFGEFTGHRWIPLTKASDAELWCLLWSAPERLSKQSVIWDHRTHHDVTAMRFSKDILDWFLYINR